ncbi:proton-coupled folate transporter-like isoform X1 [Branchiostoma floridae x Branchiostoma belcheri]
MDRKRGILTEHPYYLTSCGPFRRMSGGETSRVKPWCPVTTEPILLVAFIGLVATSPTYQQYIYNVLGNGTLPTNTSSCDANVSDPAYQRQLKAQAETSQWQLYLTLAQAIPAAISTVALGTLSDTYGRKVGLFVPLIGGMLSSIAGALIVNFSFPLEVMLAGNFLYGVMGGWTAMFSGCSAYIADITDPGKQRTFRVAVMESAVGISSLVGEIGTGYWLSGRGVPRGFQEVTWAIVGCSVFCILYLFTLKETRPRVDNKQTHNVSCTNHFRKCFNAFYEKRYDGRRRKLLLGTLAYLFALGSMITVSTLLILYVLATPFCFTSDLVGLLKAATGATFIMSLICIRVLNNCVSEFALMMIAFVSFIGGMVLLAFAGNFSNPEVAVFMVPAVMMFRAIIAPVLKTIMSREVLPSEQGTIFAVLTSMDSVGQVIFSLLFNTVYSSTVASMRGFVFLLGAGVALIAAVLIGIMQYYEPKRDYKPLSIPEDMEEDSGKNIINK